MPRVSEGQQRSPNLTLTQLFKDLPAIFLERVKEQLFSSCNHGGTQKSSVGLGNLNINALLTACDHNYT
jgi:hypothetical protein